MVNCHADRTERQIDLGADHVDGQRSLVKQNLEDAEIRIAQPEKKRSFEIRAESYNR